MNTKISCQIKDLTVKGDLIPNPLCFTNAFNGNKEKGKISKICLLFHRLKHSLRNNTLILQGTFLFMLRKAPETLHGWCI